MQLCHRAKARASVKTGQSSDAAAASFTSWADSGRVYQRQALQEAAVSGWSSLLSLTTVHFLIFTISWFLICLYTHSRTPHTLFCSGCLQGQPLPWQARIQSRGVNLASAYSNGGWLKWRRVGWNDTYVKQVKLTRMQACCAHGCVACVYVLTLALWPPSIPYSST